MTTKFYLHSLIDFFRYYSRDFSYNTGVASIRAGLLKKDTKGWQNDVSFPYRLSSYFSLIDQQLSSGRFNDSRERNRLCVEVCNSPTNLAHV
jgi:terminal uridylyltransferase